MLSKDFPFEGASSIELMHEIKKCEPQFVDPLWEYLDESGKDLVKGLLIPQEARISIEEVLQSEWIQKFSRP